MLLHLIYGKLKTKFEQLWYHINMLKVGQYGVQTNFILKFDIWMKMN